MRATLEGISKLQFAQYLISLVIMVQVAPSWIVCGENNVIFN
jgi:hypothetical protein